MIQTNTKNAVLKTLADLISKHKNEIIETNSQDVSSYAGDDESMLDRLKVDVGKVEGMIASVEEAIALNDPEGKKLYTYDPENGLHIENRAVPFGSILIIYESRPDVTIEAALTAFKAGNKILLKGGKEARQTNLLLSELWRQALEANGVSESYVLYLDYNREQTQELIKKNTRNVDLIIPRGGDGLINFVKNNTDIPTIVSGRGNNFLFVDKESDFEMAINIILNGKSRISVCNALDKILVHQDLPEIEKKVRRLITELISVGIEVHGDTYVSELDDHVITIDNESILYEEFLAAKIMIAKADSIDAAIRSINKYSGKHSATIVTENKSHAEHFLQRVDCAAVYHNASTRFTDGGQFGFGAEMAISTQKVHFRGPVGIDQLVTNKWFVYGSGQIR